METARSLSGDERPHSPRDSWRQALVLPEGDYHPHRHPDQHRRRRAARARPRGLRQLRGAREGAGPAVRSAGRSSRAARGHRGRPPRRERRGGRVHASVDRGASRAVRSLDPTVLFSPDGATRVQLGSLSRTTKDILREGLQGDHLFILPASLFEGKTNYGDIEFLVYLNFFASPEDADAHRRHRPAVARRSASSSPSRSSACSTPPRPRSGRSSSSTGSTGWPTAPPTTSSWPPTRRTGVRRRPREPDRRHPGLRGLIVLEGDDTPIPDGARRRGAGQPARPGLRGPHPQCRRAGDDQAPGGLGPPPHGRGDPRGPPRGDPVHHRPAEIRRHTARDQSRLRPGRRSRRAS